jgi:hypothetical protein
MKMRLLAGAAALALSAAGAQAATITVSQFSVGAYNTAVGGTAGKVVENFESYAVGNVGNGTESPGFSTAVGTFFTMGGTGTGGTVTDPNPDLNGSKLAIRTGLVYGRSSTTDILAGQSDSWSDGINDKFLDSNDTFGIRWLVNIGSMFNRIVFTLTDSTDVGATMTIRTDGATPVTYTGLGNANRRLVVVDFLGGVNSAEITFFNSFSNNLEKGFLNDGFSIDDVSVAPVPLPAPAFMLIAGLAGLAAIRRKRAAA